MLYLTVDEVSLLNPNVDVPTTPTDKRLAYIHQASRLIDIACRRTKYGLGMVDIIDAQIPLDLNYNGFLPNTPFRSWISTTASVIVKNGGRMPTVSTSDFDVQVDPGIIRYVGNKVGTWANSNETNRGPWSETVAPYHTDSLYQIEDNSYPYIMTASFRSGLFAITSIAATGITPAGSTQVTVTDATDLSVGRQFYFSTDPTLEPEVDRRNITAITGSVVTFTPALGYNLPNTAKFRQIDHAIRAAVGIIIADSVTFQPGLKKFYKSLGQGDLTKSWERFGSHSVTPAVYELIGPYIKF